MANLQSVAPPAGVRIGGWLSIPDPLVVEIVGRTGYDWVGIDLQHGAWDLELAFRGIQLLDVLGVPVLVRVSEDDLSLIPRVLDQGASGVVIAMVSGPDLVHSAIKRARYQPEGLRSYGGQRYGMRVEPADVAEIRPAIYAMIEDRRGLASINEIAHVPGLAGLHVGPVDLGLGIGVGKDRSRPAFGEALATIVAAGHAAGLPVALHAVKAGEAARSVELGFDELVLTADVEVLRANLRDELAAARRASAIAPVATSAAATS